MLLFFRYDDLEVDLIIPSCWGYSCLRNDKDFLDWCDWKMRWRLWLWIWLDRVEERSQGLNCDMSRDWTLVVRDFGSRFFWTWAGNRRLLRETFLCWVSRSSGRSVGLVPRKEFSLLWSLKERRLKEKDLLSSWSSDEVMFTIWGLKQNWRSLLESASAFSQSPLLRNWLTAVLPESSADTAAVPSVTTRVIREDPSLLNQSWR